MIELLNEISDERAIAMKILKKEPMLTVSVIAAIISLFITPPSKELLHAIDWHTLGTLFMMLTILEGFKKEHIFNPLLRLASRMGYLVTLSLFLVFSVFFSSMFVTNDVSLIIFVPLTILLFRAAKREEFILPLLAMENIAAVRGSLLMPFGSPQNLFIYSQSGMSAAAFIGIMFPIWIISLFLLILFVAFPYRKNLKEKALIADADFTVPDNELNKKKQIAYLVLFAMVLFTIVSRTTYWPYAVIIVAVMVAIIDYKILIKTDYVLLLTFLCFFIFSSSIAANETIAAFLHRVVGHHEYVVSIVLSQFISNVPASIVLYPFSENVKALLYGLDSAGLCTLIGSLASVINYRIYVREYPDSGLKFIKYFTLISLAFFAFVALPGYFISR
ncbi:MAG: hypothetical protein J5876_06930 [Lachnospiraceae bacterium]|nr:hypothetical protein [Lachnospiraceae bacterium]